MSRRGHAWRKGSAGALYLGDGSAGQTLTTEGRAEAPVVALYNAAGTLLATRPGYKAATGSVVVTWDGAPLDTMPAKEKDPRAPHARYRATVPAREVE